VSSGEGDGQPVRHRLDIGKTRRDARRAHKRQLANRVIRRMWRDEHARRAPLASAA
jgi:hypothetical protein